MKKYRWKFHNGKGIGRHEHYLKIGHFVLVVWYDMQESNYEFEIYTCREHGSEEGHGTSLPIYNIGFSRPENLEKAKRDCIKVFKQWLRPAVKRLFNERS